MVDIHCHILPGVDDGAKSWDMALEMCRLAQQDGIQHIVATPHANDAYAYRREYLLACLEELRRRVGDPLTFSLGCDFRLSYANVEDALAHPRRYTIGQGSYLLVEFSDYGIPPRISDSLFSLRAKNITPVITHPERNPILQRHLQQVLKWVQEGCLVQLTASALAGTWGEASRRSANWLLEHDAVHVLASDAHDHKYRQTRALVRTGPRSQAVWMRDSASIGRTQSPRYCGQPADPVLSGTGYERVRGSAVSDVASRFTLRTSVD